MASIEIPESLPAGFREIWRALQEADEQSSSRQALARRLGISTHTIQRILVDGDVPDLAGTSNLRVTRAWVRILTRLAHHLGADTRSWVEAAGVSWCGEVESVVEEATARLTAREAAIRPDLGLEGPGEEVLPQVRGYEFPDEIGVTVAAWGPLGLRVVETDRSYLETYLSRLIHTIRPDCRIRITAADADVNGAVIAAEEGAGHGTRGGGRIVAGVTNTLALRMAGLDFVGLPGLKIRLSALALRKKPDRMSPPTWTEAVSPGLWRDNKYLVAQQGLAYHFLRGQCGLTEENLIVRETRDPAEIAETLSREAALWESSIHQERWVILVDDEETCHGVRLALSGRDDVRRDFVVEELQGIPEDFPAYQIGIAVPARDREIRDLLKAATMIDLFGSGRAHTARLYANLIAAGFMRRNLGYLVNPAISYGPHILTDFREADGVFRGALCRALIRLLTIRIDEALSERGVFKTPEAVKAQARYLAHQHALNLVPASWTGDLGRITALPDPVSDRGLLEVPAGHCLSCSGSLLDEGHRGVSDRYCRVCADEGGNLKPREDVREIMAQWFESWHGRMDHDEALRHADIFMNRMPAWCDN